MSYETIENEKPYTRRENFYYYNRDCFLIIYNNCPQKYCGRT